MKFIKLPILILAGAALISGCSDSRTDAPLSSSVPIPTNAQPKSPAPAAPAFTPSIPNQAQPKLPTIKLWLGAQEMNAELALNAGQMRTGMMFRTNMEANGGMLFVLPQPQQAGFWMKNCFVPLSAAYIDSEGTILEIHPLQPQNTNPVLSAAANVQYVLETPQGWFDRNQVSTGAMIRTEQGSLPETFFRKR